MPSVEQMDSQDNAGKDDGDPYAVSRGIECRDFYEVPDFYGVLVRGVETKRTRHLPRTKSEALLGFREFRSRISWGAALTEFNFTSLLHFFHVSIVQSVDPGVFSSPLLAIALAKFIVILLCTYAGAASGAHMNPNITFATVLVGRTTIARCIMYTIAQVLGAIFGIAAARLAHGWDATNTPADLGCCGVGNTSTVGALVGTTFFFHWIMCIIGGLAFDDRQADIFGSILGPICICAAVSVGIFASTKTAILINWAECLAVGIVGGGFNGSEWISFVGPSIAAVYHACLYLTVPPSQAEGKLIPPLFKNVKKE